MFVVLAFGLFVNQKVWAQVDQVELSYNSKMLLSEKALTPQQALAVFSKQQIENIEAEFINPGNLPLDSWILIEKPKLNLQEHYLLELERGKARHIDVYSLDQAGNFSLLEPLPRLHYHPIFLLSPEQNSATHLLIKLDYSVGVFKPVLWEYQEYIMGSHYDLVQSALFFGILLCLAIYNLVIFFAVRQQAYIWYALYIFALIIWRGCVLGYAAFFGIPHYAAQIYITEPLVMLDILFALLFCMHFLGTAQVSYRLDKFMYAMCFLVGFGALVSPILPSQEAILLIAMALVITVPLCIISSFLAIRRKVRAAKYYFMSWIPLVVTVVLVQLTVWKVIESYHFAVTMIHYAILLEVFLMSLALADKLRFEQAQKNYFATHEPVTRLPNRHLINISLENLKAYSGFAVVLIRIDQFNQLEQMFGYKVTNEILREVSLRLNKWSKLKRRAVIFDVVELEAQKVGYFENGCFVIGLRGKQHDFNALCKQVNELLGKPVEPFGVAIDVCASIGVSLYPDHGKKTSELLENANLAAVKSACQHELCNTYKKTDSQTFKARFDDLRLIAGDLKNKTNFSLSFAPLVLLSNQKAVAWQSHLLWYNQQKSRHVEASQYSHFTHSIQTQLAKLNILNVLKYITNQQGEGLYYIRIEIELLEDSRFFEEMLEYLLRRPQKLKQLRLEIVVSPRDLTINIKKVTSRINILHQNGISKVLNISQLTPEVYTLLDQCHWLHLISDTKELNFSRHLLALAKHTGRKVCLHLDTAQKISADEQDALTEFVKLHQGYPEIQVNELAGVVI